MTTRLPASDVLLSPLPSGARNLSYVSCALGNIYRNGAWFDDPALLNEFCHGQAAALGPEIVAELFPPYGYSRPPPALFGENRHLVDHVAAVAADVAAAHPCGAGSVLARARNACVSGSVIYILYGSETRVIYETFRPIDRGVTGLRPDFELRSVDESFDAAQDRIHFWLGSVGSGNYGHWLVDDLPRLRALSALRAVNPFGTIVVVTTDVNGLHNQIHRDSCTALCGEAGLGRIEMLFVKPDARLFFRELYFATPPTHHPVSKSPDAIDWVSRTVQQAGMSDQESLPRRIFVQRAYTGRRDLANQAEIATLLAGHGFTGIDTGVMPFRLQARLFGNAEMVIGCMGAAMTNVMFSPPGTPTGYIAPEGWVETFYWDLAAVRQHRYAVCFGSTTPQDSPPWQKNYRINPRHVLEMLDFLQAG